MNNCVKYQQCSFLSELLIFLVYSNDFSSRKRAAQLESELLKFEDSIESQSDELTALKAQLERTRKAMNESQRRIDILRAKKDGLAADSLLGRAFFCWQIFSVDKDSFHCWFMRQVFGESYFN